MSFSLLCILFSTFQTADYLRSHTYANVPGNKYPLLIQYFTLLEQCIEQGATVKVGSITSRHAMVYLKLLSYCRKMSLYLLIFNSWRNLNPLFQVKFSLQYIHYEQIVCFVFSDVNYKQLMSGEGDPLLLLTPLLTSFNVHVVAKAASKIPCQVQCVHHYKPTCICNKVVGHTRCLCKIMIAVLYMIHLLLFMRYFRS